MATYFEMRESAAKLIADARSKLDEIKDDTPEERGAEIETEADRMLDEAAAIEKRADREERLAKAQKRAEQYAEDVETGRRPSVGGEARGADNGNEVSYRDAFHAYLRAGGNVGEMALEARSVLARGGQPVETRAQTTTDSAGGYTVPEEMMPTVVKSMKAWGPMYDGDVVTEIVTMGGAAMPLPTVDDTTVTAGAHTEGATMTDDGGKDATFGTKQLDGYEFDTEWLRVSKALADDSFLAMETFIGELLGERLARIANLQLTTGTGSSAPNGVVTASSLGKTAASATAVTMDEILDLEHSVNSAYRRSPKVAYMFSDTTLLAIRKLKDGEGNYLWQQGNVRAGIPNTFNGRTYHVNDDMPAIATGNKSILFGDFGKYFVRKVGQPLIGAISDKDFWPGFGIAGYIRFDGELGDTAAVKHLIQA